MRVHVIRDDGRVLEVCSVDKESVIVCFPAFRDSNMHRLLMRVCVYLTVASSHYAAALSRPHTFPYLGQANAFQVIVRGSLHRQELGLHSKNSCQSSLCKIESFTRATGVGKWNVLVGVWEFILLGFAWLCGELRLTAATDAKYGRVTQDSADRMSTSASSSIRR